MGESGPTPGCNNIMLPGSTDEKNKLQQETTQFQHPKSEDNRRRHVLKRTWFYVVDQVLVVLIISPLVVGYWRGTWQLIDIHLFPDNPEISGWVSLAVGTFIPTGFVLAQGFLARLFRPDRSFLVFFYASRVYSAIFALTVVNQWRGVWQLLDQYTGTHVIANGVGMLVGALGLAYWRSLRNILAPPLVIVVDSPSDYFSIVTRFKQQAKDRFLEFALDAAFSVFILGSLVVFVWRGAWGLFDYFLFPEDLATSAWCSLVLGITLTTIFLFLQKPASLRAKSLDPTPSLIFEDFFIFLANLGPINVWRGCWGLFDCYLYPDDYELSNWITSVSGFVVLLLIYCVNSILVRGICVDGERQDGKGCSFDTDYLARIFRSRSIRKTTEVLQKRRELVPLNQDNMTSPAPRILPVAEEFLDAGGGGSKQPADGMNVQLNGTGEENGRLLLSTPKEV